jgi:hypothetical protein
MSVLHNYKITDMNMCVFARFICAEKRAT